MIRYTAHDQAYNRASCKFSVRVQGEAGSPGAAGCLPLPPGSAPRGWGRAPSPPALTQPPSSQ